MTAKWVHKKVRRGQASVKLLALFLFVALPTLILSAPKAEAAPGDHGVGLGLGQILLMGDFGKYFDNGIGFNLQYSYEASQMFGLLVDINMSNHSDSTNLNSLGIKGLSPNLRVNLAYIDKLILLAFGGFGLFKVDETIGSVSGGVTTFGLNMGVAANLALDKHFQFGTALGFHNIFGKTDSSTAVNGSPGISIGGTYIGLMLNAMYIF